MAWCTRRLPSQEPGPVAGDEHGRTASQHPRRARPEVATGAAASPAVFPSKTPQPAPRAVLRAAVGRSSDSWARGRGLLLLPPLPKASGLSALWRVRSQLPLRGSAGMAIEGVTGFPFNPAGSNPPEPTSHKIVGATSPVNAKSCGWPHALVAQAFPPRRPGAAVAARPSRLRSQAPGRRFTSRERPAHSWCAVRIAPP